MRKEKGKEKTKGGRSGFELFDHDVLLYFRR